MSYSQTQHESSAVAAVELVALGLDAVELAALRRQGSVVREVRGRIVVYKLRFRLWGRHRTKYLGTDAARAARLALELEDLQSVRRVRRRLRTVRRECAEALRAAKRVLEPTLESAGLHFHGYALRRPRVRTKGSIVGRGHEVEIIL